MTAAVLRVRALDVEIGDGPPVRGLSLDVEEGRLHVLLGGAGAGKSAAIGAIMPGDGRIGGSVRLGGVEIDRLAPFERARLGVALAGQRPALLAPLSVRDHLRLGAGGTLRPEIEAWLLDLLPELRDILRSTPQRLDRRRRRIADLARALAASPSLLLADELGLDLGAGRATAILRRLADGGRAVLAAERFPHPALATADAATVLLKGAVARQGTAEALRGDPDVAALCLGEAA